MTLQFSVNNSISLSGDVSVREYLFQWKEFMVANGWTVPQSSNGTTGGSTGGTGSGGVGDHIIDRDDLNQHNPGVSESWFVLRSPDGREMKWNRYNSSGNVWYMSYSPSDGFPFSGAAGYPVGNQPDNPADNVEVIGATRDLCTGGNIQVHMCCDDEAPYSFYSWVHNAGNFNTGRHFLAMVPITTEQPGDTDPVVFVVTGNNETVTYANLDDEIAVSIASRTVGYMPNQGVYVGMALGGIETQRGVCFPSGISQDDNGADPSIPLLPVRNASQGNGGFKGFSTFMQNNGVARAGGETFASRTRISVGDYNMPWDGATQPVAS